MASDMTQTPQALAQSLLGMDDVTAVTSDREVLEQAARMLVRQAEEIETLRQLKDGYYDAMALWREAKQTGEPFEAVQARRDARRAAA